LLKAPLIQAKTQSGSRQCLHSKAKVKGNLSSTIILGKGFGFS
jgi:hypothetical protein